MITLVIFPMMLQHNEIAIMFTERIRLYLKVQGWNCRYCQYLTSWECPPIQRTRSDFFAELQQFTEKYKKILWNKRELKKKTKMQCKKFKQLRRYKYKYLSRATKSRDCCYNEMDVTTNEFYLRKTAEKKYIKTARANNKKKKRELVFIVVPRE